MRRALFIAALLPLLACQPQPSALTDAERAAIAERVNALTTDVFESAAHLDAAAFVKGYGDDSTVRITENGVAYTKTQYRALADSQYRTLQTISPINKRVAVTVLGRDAAIATVPFAFTATTKGGRSASTTGVWTGTFRKANGTWEIVASHESEPDIVGFMAALNGPPKK